MHKMQSVKQSITIIPAGIFRQVTIEAIFILQNGNVDVGIELNSGHNSQLCGLPVQSFGDRESIEIDVCESHYVCTFSGDCFRVATVSLYKDCSISVKINYNESERWFGLASSDYPLHFGSYSLKIVN